MKAPSKFLAVVAALASLGGCASYHEEPLPQRPDLAPSVASLDVTLPGTTGESRKINTAQPLTIDEIGLLAILNDPDLKSEGGAIDVARAGVVQASILPNPSANLSYGQLLGGPATTSSIAASLSQEIVPIITRGARVAAAKAHFAQVDADQLWREWQVAQKARQLALDIAFGGRSIALTQREARLIDDAVALVQQAVSAGNLTVSALSPLLSAKAAAEQSLVTLRLAHLKNWQALDALLGLMPQARFAVAPPALPPLPGDIEPLAASLPNRRPDLAALRLGYGSAEENVRAAILGQFPALTIGGTYGSDTSAVESAGPSLAFSLPILDRNQGNIAKTAATRRLLREQYQARLDTAVATIHALLAQMARLTADLGPARAAAAAARSLAETARRAFAQGNIDQRTLTDYETTELERALQVISIERQIGTDRILLAVELGLGLPPTRLAISG